MNFKLISTPLEQINLKDALSNIEAGAFCAFEGWVRQSNDNKRVTALEYEAEAVLCEKEAQKIFNEAKERFNALDLICYHRVGTLNVGDIAVSIAATAAHRDGAFIACRYVIDEIKKRLPIWKKEHYAKSESAWLNCQQHPSNINVVEKLFFAKQTALPQVGRNGQQKLHNAKVLVAGSGGLGCWALKSLAGLGFGTIGICEGDMLEESNLSRQGMYKFEDIGKRKNDLAAENLKAYSPYATVIQHDYMLNAENVLNTLERYDIILDCTDNFTAKFLINDACVLLSKKFITASVYQFEGQLFAMNPPQSACLRCLWANIPSSVQCSTNCEEAGVIAPLPALLGHWQALEAAKLILGIGTTNQALIVFNALNNSQEMITFKRNISCPICSDNATIKSIQPENYANHKSFSVSATNIEAMPNAVFVDIREHEELKNRPLTEVAALHLPLSKGTHHFYNWEINKQYILICTKGKRSLKLAKELHDKNINNILALEGGLDKIGSCRNIKNLTPAHHD